ncbi:hypothetical protein KC222_10850 [Cedecea davisae]|uniref:Capsule polysaccharide biosynthesis protein n=1 Tax=Cedecea davisae TaxID=158484 RepID=A0ABS6DH31_9ENTR|nr:hypothetical protein [Cedecea davisae]MBU4682513.1 hypothetical protein [Cedecea davisae]MBU4688053.1 hypothetical protein [Cedecea davisae]
MLPLNTDDVVNTLRAIQPKLYISTGNFARPQICMTNPDYLSRSHWPWPRILNSYGQVLAVYVQPEKNQSENLEWYNPGTWRLQHNWKSLCSSVFTTDHVAADIIPLVEWYASVQQRVLSGGERLTTAADPVPKKRL